MESGQDQTERAGRELGDLVVMRLTALRSQDEIVRELVKMGIAPDEAARIVETISRVPDVRKAIEQVYRRKIKFGTYWVIGGVIMTMLSLMSPVAGGSWIFWGAIVFGAIDIVRANSGLQRFLATGAGPEANGEEPVFASEGDYIEDFCSHCAHFAPGYGSCTLLKSNVWSSKAQFDKKCGGAKLIEMSTSNTDQPDVPPLISPPITSEPIRPK